MQSKHKQEFHNNCYSMYPTGGEHYAKLFLISLVAYAKFKKKKKKKSDNLLKIQSSSILHRKFSHKKEKNRPTPKNGHIL